MNIFVLDLDPKLAAINQVDKHVVKMTLETAQLLSTCHRVLESPWRDSVYKQTHVNHPCSVWLRQSRANYQWLFQHFIALLDEYTFRYGKVHKCSNYVDILENCPISSGDDITPFALAMPEEYKKSCPVDSYVTYYIGEKANMFKWTKRTPPKWAQKS